LKKSTSSVRFRFYKPETEKTKPNPNQKNWKKTRAKQKNQAKTKLNWFEPVFILIKPNQTETGRFKQISVIFLKKIGLISFFYKN